MLAVVHDVVLAPPVQVLTDETVQFTVFPAAVVHPEPVDVLLDSTVLVPANAAKLGSVALHAENPEPLL